VAAHHRSLDFVKCILVEDGFRYGEQADLLQLSGQGNVVDFLTVELQASRQRDCPGWRASSAAIRTACAWRLAER
jgi:hypothetical protein